MRGVIEILKEQVMHFGMIFRLARYETKAANAHKYLGQLWELLDPFFQVATYFVIFSIGMRTKAPTPYQDMPYLAWMILGMTAWYFTNNAYSDTIRSINSQVRMVSKMKFPISIFPSIRIVQRFISLATLSAVSIYVLWRYDIAPTAHWFQVIYYLAAAIIFVFALGLLTATLVVIVPDVDNLARTIMRMVFWVSGVLWQVQPGGGLGAKLLRAIESINPFYYIVSGFRESIIGHTWFWEIPRITGIFWLETIIILILATHVHLKFREQFVDFI